MKKSHKRVVYILIACIAIVCFCLFQNNALVTTTYNYRSDEVPQAFDGYKIVQLSDLHNKAFGKNQSRLVKRVEKQTPDLIVVTGDLIDSEKYNERIALELMEKLVDIAPVYFVTGNHEWWSGKYETLEMKLKDMGVNVLRNEVEELSIGTDKVQLIGIDDPAIPGESYDEHAVAEEAIKASMETVEQEADFTILLSHRPELISLYADYNMDVVFSGHAHGGQFRIPFVGGVVAPNQGLFPTYTAGQHKMGQTTMIVNRGLGNSIIPLRIFNRPEIVVLTLESGSS
ncbi:metallophosphoesterase [Radiobacillus sp. PE A8.2]|uniref:metallophosphoesterase n=1 Tax=Radiobacillus sp. PE A8.2 TaxID=3380349 RepID=UPI0038905758